MVVIGVALATFGKPSKAGEMDGTAVLGGALGGATGAAIGSAMGGREGAVIGAGVGGALGAAVASHKPQPKVVTKEVIHVRDVHHYYHPKRHRHGWHRGHHKHKHRHWRDD
jgi:uncharacterized protein YcfJ